MTAEYWGAKDERSWSTFRARNSGHHHHISFNDLRRLCWTVCSSEIYRYFPRMPFSVKWFTAIWNHNPSSTSLSSWKKNRSSYHCCFNWSVIIKIVNVVTGLAVVIINNSLIDCPQWSHGIYGGQFWRIFPHISYSNTCGVYMSLRPMCTPQYCCQIFWMVLVVYVNGLFIVRYM